MKRLVFISFFCLMTLTPNSRDALGDVNNDGTIDVQDIVLMVDIILSDGIDYGEYELWASDVNLDENTDVVDIVLMVPVILATDNCEENYSPCPNNFSICCLDTTSHYVNWEIDTLGTPGSYSSLYDIAVIDENNIWVVGEIHTGDTDQFDSTGTWVTPFNAANWDGNDWALVRIIPEGYLWAIYTAIFAFNENDIWFGTSGLVHWDGAVFTPYSIEQGYPPGMGYAKKIWGTEDRLFIIYHNGGIVHYNNETFEQMESGTEVTLKSITGTGPDNVWVSGDNLDFGENLHTLLHYDGATWTPIFNGPPTWDYISGMISGVIENVYTDHPDSVWIQTHLGFYRSAVSTYGEGDMIGEISNWESVMHDMDGISHNDLFVAGGFTTIWHYNGVSFHQYQDIPYLGPIYSFSICQDLIVLTGDIVSSNQSFVLRGSRLN